MADINTYTATPCGPTPGPSYEVDVVSAAMVPVGNLGAVRVSTNPDTYKCCSIDRTQVNQTPEEDVKPVVDSGYATSQCEDCQDKWE